MFMPFYCAFAARSLLLFCTFYFFRLAARKCLLSGCISAWASCRFPSAPLQQTHIHMETETHSQPIRIYKYAYVRICPFSLSLRSFGLSLTLSLAASSTSTHLRNKDYNFISISCFSACYAHKQNASENGTSYLPRPFQKWALSYECVCLCVCL